MNEWEAKYKALLMGIDNREYIDNAEQMVRTAQRLAATGLQTFDEVMWAMIQLTQMQQVKDSQANVAKILKMKLK